MYTSRSHLLMATALAAGLLAAVPFRGGAEESATVPTNPGFKSDGQINLGYTPPVPSSSIDFRKVPTPEEARAAFLAPSDPNPVAGAQAAQPQNNAGANNKTTSPQAAGGDPTTATQGQAAIGGPLSPGASAGSSAAGSTSTDAGNQQASSAGRETVGARPVSDSRPGPIGATGQTMPEQFSSRNEILDRVPTMAWPQTLSDQERRQIYQAVMADKSQPAADADALMPASELSTEQALTGMHELPASLNGIAAARKLRFVKGKNKVLLVEPSTRIVVEQITS